MMNRAKITNDGKIYRKDLESCNDSSKRKNQYHLGSWFEIKSPTPAWSCKTDDTRRKAERIMEDIWKRVKIDIDRNKPSSFGSINEVVPQKNDGQQPCSDSWLHHKLTLDRENNDEDWKSLGPYDLGNKSEEPRNIARKKISKHDNGSQDESPYIFINKLAPLLQFLICDDFQFYSKSFLQRIELSSFESNYK